MAEENRCPQCGAELPASAPHGICPQCIMKVGLPSGVAADEADAHMDQKDVPTSATPPAGFVAPQPAELASQFPQLEILEFLGQGGMGAVYKARQKRLGRLVALKILPPQVGRDPAFAERFEREARSMAMLSHPHIVAVYDFGQTQEGLYYFTMEFVDGTDLRHVIQAGSLKPSEALAIVPQICEALQYAHEEGLVHRDIKPENILMDKKGHVKIADFGLARLLEEPGIGLTLTQPHQRMGTPHYMAPEQIERPHEVDHRADIYSLGVVFYEMLTGELPLGKFAPPSRKVHVDVRLDQVVLRSLEKEPELRYQQASEVKTDVESVRAGGGPAMPIATSPALPVPAVNPMEKHVMIVAVLGIAFGAMGILVGIAGFAAVVGGGIVSQDRTAMRITSLVGTGVVLFFVVTSVPKLIAGVGLLKRRGWARILAIILAVLDLLSFPIGTVIAIYTLWVLLNDKAALLFSRNATGQTDAQPASGTEPAIQMPHATSVAPTPRRLSRAAIAGACIAPLALLAVLVATLHFAMEARVTSPGTTVRAYGIGPAVVIVLPFLLLGLSAPFLTTILGFVSIAHIRHSTGRLYGMGLALFDALLFPLLLLDVAIVCIAASNPARGLVGDYYSRHVLIAAILLCLLVDVLAVRWTRRKVNAPAS